MGDLSGRDYDAENSTWTWEENKIFENSLVEFPEDFPNRWEKIVENVVAKSAAELEQHYAVLLDDVASIEAGLIEPPEYGEFRLSEPLKSPKSEKKLVVVQRKAAKPWTEDEHRFKKTNQPTYHT